MYNTDFPSRADLPTHAQLKRSSFIAAASAAVLLVTIVFPSEYGVDVTGIGGLLQLTEMGEIKTQLAEEAAADRLVTAAANVVPAQPSNAVELSALTSRLAALERAFYEGPAKATAQDAQPVEKAAFDPEQPALPALDESPDEVSTGSLGMTSTEATPGGKQDEMSVVLQPGEGTEIKMAMEGGAKANFWWSANGRLLNYDAHGEGDGQSVSYDKGRGIGQDEGVMTASFTGNHGWFWRNRSNEPVTLTVRTNGDYSQLKRMK